ncbi:enoyl-CoA hydratase [Tepidicaulis sp. LMO-SS28]|uniref:enoyl-CoA hydratase n=1 Tax=Tepidicaulis sp. LMO-SS28 TaxID=3447455 RepID=UPI003EDF7579
MTDHLKTDIKDGILTVTFNRPEKKNALTQGMYGAAADAINAAQGDKAVRVILLTGAGDAFTAGNDLADFAGAGGKSDSAEPPVSRFLQSILRSEKPLVAAVNGLAIGVGVTMLLHCDIVYAGASATFQTPFVNLGLVPEAGSSLLLPKAVGTQKANELFLLGKKIGADEAARIGLVATTVADDKLMETAMDAARTLAAKAPSAVKATKKLARGNIEEIAERMAEEGKTFAAQLQTAEFAEAAAAFAEKRTPDFTKVA